MAVLTHQLKNLARRLLHGEAGSVGLLDLLVGAVIVVGVVYGYQPVADKLNELNGQVTTQVNSDSGAGGQIRDLKQMSPQGLMERTLGPVSDYEDEMLSRTP
jgi:hypothetical protein